MKKTIITSAILLSLSSATVLAGNISHNGTEAYVHGTDGNIVSDRYGKCVRTVYWSEAKSIDACEGRKTVVAKPATKPAPKPVVAAPVVVAPVAVVKPVVVVQSKVSVVAPMSFSGFFATSGASLTSKAKTQLNDYVEYLNENTDAKVKVLGHTDSRGAASFNQRLSLKRANSVKDYLNSKGVSANRIETVGMGESNPVASNMSKVGRAENRRVDLEIVK